ncbi:hypothetical protein ACFPFV_08340 [Salinicoccus siamensis]
MCGGFGPCQVLGTTPPLLFDASRYGRCFFMSISRMVTRHRHFREENIL